MSTRTPELDWLFGIDEAPVHATVTHKGVVREVPLPHKKALVAGDTGQVLGIVGSGYKVFSNREAVELGFRFCHEAFPDTKPAEWTFAEGHGPRTRSWVAMDIHHQAHAMNLMGSMGRISEVYTPFVRITNSYNGSRAVRLDVGFLRKHCDNGMIFEEEAATLSVPHTRQGILSLQWIKPFEGMTALREDFGKALAGIQALDMTREEGLRLVREVTGWPTLPEKPRPWERAEQERLDADLASRLERYFGELGGNAYAVFNTMTDIASHPPKSARFRRDRPTLERRAGVWLREFRREGVGTGGSVARQAAGARRVVGAVR